MERDTKTAQDRLRELEEEVEKAVESLRAKDQEIEDRDGKIEELRQTAHAIARTMGTFIQTNIRSWVDTVDLPSTQEVLQIIADYAQPEDPRSVQYVRLPEQTVAKHARDLREAYDLVEDYRKVMKGQGAMISDQSKNLDDYMKKYETAVNLVTERDKEIQHLLQRQDQVSKQLKDCESSLAESKATTAQAETMARRYEELHGDMDILREAHKLELGHRDEEIASLRLRLQTAFGEVFHKSGGKHVMFQEPDALSAVGGKGSSMYKAARFFGMETHRDRSKRGGLPASHSMIGFASTDTAYDSRVDGDLLTMPRPRQSPRLDTSGLPIPLSHDTPIDDSQASNDSTMVLSGVDSRYDSLASAPHHGNLASPVNIQKSLPAPPAPFDTELLTAVRISDVKELIVSPTAAQITSDYFQNSILGKTSARPGLSHVPAVTISGPSESNNHDRKEHHVTSEDADESDESVASSDREVFRKSICALDMLNSATGLPYSETETDLEKIMRGVPTTSPERSTQPDDHESAEEQEVQTGTARVLHLRPANSNLRAAVRQRPGEREAKGGSGREERFRESVMSDSSGYRTEDSEPKTVAQLYHQSRRHIRG